MVKIYQQPFAHAGLKQVIPDASDPQGFVSNEDGFTSDYELPDTDPNYKPIERAEFNGLMNMVTEAVGELQQFGFAKWQAVDGGWPQGANVNHGGGVWQSLANANAEEPGTGASWKPIVFDDIGQATEADLGLVRLATTAQSQALVNDTDALTPAKLAAAFGGANQVLTNIGYQILPGGLIIQWGLQSPPPGPATTYAFPLTFPSSVFSFVAVHTGEDPIANAVGKFISTSQYSLSHSVGVYAGVAWIAIGK